VLLDNYDWGGEFCWEVDKTARFLIALFVSFTDPDNAHGTIGTKKKNATSDYPIQAFGASLKKKWKIKLRC